MGGGQWGSGWSEKEEKNRREERGRNILSWKRSFILANLGCTCDDNPLCAARRLCNLEWKRGARRGGVGVGGGGAGLEGEDDIKHSPKL